MMTVSPFDIICRTHQIDFSVTGIFLFSFYRNLQDRFLILDISNIPDIWHQQISIWYKYDHMKYQYNLYHRTAISMHTLKFINPSSFLLFGSCLLFFLTSLCLSFTLLFFVCSLLFLFFSSLQIASLHSSFAIPSYCSFSTIAAYINSNPTFHNTTNHNKAQSCYRITKEK